MPLSERVYLYKILFPHEIWRNKEFWESVIFESVYQEITNSKIMYKDNKSSTNELIIREKNIIFS